MTAEAFVVALKLTVDADSVFVRPVPDGVGVVSHAPPKAAPGVHLNVATELGGSVALNARPAVRTSKA